MAAAQDINEGDTLCFFYPSTEWDMKNPFECNCATEVSKYESKNFASLITSQTCLGTIRGAAHLTREQLEQRGFVNRHILELVEQRDSSQNL